eukprot:331247_1
MAGQSVTSLQIKYIPNTNQHRMNSNKPSTPPAPPRCNSLYTQRAVPRPPPKPKPKSNRRLEKYKSISLPPQNRALPPDFPIYAPHNPPIQIISQHHSTRSLPSLPPHKRSLPCDPSAVHVNPHKYLLRKQESAPPASQRNHIRIMNSSTHTYTHDGHVSPVPRRKKSSRSSSAGSDYHCKSRSQSPHPRNKRNVRCICGRRMKYTQNPQNQYPPDAVMYCQQSMRCKKKMMIQRDWFYCCKSRTSYHGTKDGKFKICSACSVNATAKQERIRKNHQLLIKQLKSKDHGHVIITNETKEYILSSTSANSKDQTLKLLKQTYMDNVHVDVSANAASDYQLTHSLVMIGNQKRYKVIKEGFMMKKGNVWNTAFKKRYFKLFENKQLFYYKTYENGMASDQRGMANLNVIDDMRKKGKNGLEISTPGREWKFLCNDPMDRDQWWTIISSFTKNGKYKSSTVGSLNSIS